MNNIARESGPVLKEGSVLYKRGSSASLRKTWLASDTLQHLAGAAYQTTLEEPGFGFSSCRQINEGVLGQCPVIEYCSSFRFWEKQGEPGASPLPKVPLASGKG